MIRVSVMYPNQGGKFDIDYYLSKHVGLVHRLLDPYGLTRVEVDKGISTAPPEAPAPYVAIAHLVFESLDKMQEGLKAHDAELAADLPNFTDIQPQFQISEMFEK